MRAVRPNASDPGTLPILAVAAQAFMELGYTETSIDEIADRLGASKGRVYHYYRKKGDILLDIHSRAIERFLAAARPIAEDKRLRPEERLRLMAREHLLQLMSDVPSARVSLFSSMNQPFMTDKQRRVQSDISVLRRRYEDMFARAIEEAMHAGAFRRFDVSLATRLTLGVLNWTCTWYRPRGGKSLPPEVVADEAVAFVLGGLLPRGRVGRS